MVMPSLIGGFGNTKIQRKNYTTTGSKYLNNDSSLQKRSFSTSRCSNIKPISGIGHKKYLNPFSPLGPNLIAKSSFSTSAVLRDNEDD